MSSTNYLIVGDDEYLKEREEAKIRENFLSPEEIDLNYSVYRPDESDDIFNSLNTVPFLADKRVILIKDAHQLSRDALEAVLSYLEKPSQTNVLVLSAGGEFKKDKLYRKLSALVDIIEADKPDPVTIKKWIQSFFKKEGIEVSREAVDILCELKGQDTVGVKTELEKLASYSGGKRIEAGDVEQLVGRSVTETIYKMVDAINAGDAGWVFRILGDLYDQKKQPHEIIGYLAWYLKVMQKIILLSGKKAGINVIAAELGYSAGYVKRLAEQARGYTADKVGKWVSWLLETDRDIKTGKKEANLALESLLVKFLKSPA